MTLTANDYSVGTHVILNSQRLADYGITEGSEGSVDMIDYNELRVVFPTGTYWCDPSWVSPADLATITDIDLYKRLAVRRLYEHKKINGWCGTAEGLAAKVGLADLLPIKAKVSVPVEVSVMVFPGETDEAAISNARMMLNENFGSNGRVRTATVERREADWSGYDVDETPEGETLDQFKERLAKTALRGARDHGVSGVPDFLRAVGIDPSTIKETRRVYASVSFDVEVDAEQNATEFGRDLLTLALPADVAVNEVYF